MNYTEAMPATVIRGRRCLVLFCASKAWHREGPPAGGRLAKGEEGGSQRPSRTMTAALDRI